MFTAFSASTFDFENKMQEGIFTDSTANYWTSIPEDSIKIAIKDSKDAIRNCESMWTSEFLAFESELAEFLFSMNNEYGNKKKIDLNKNQLR